MIPVGTVSIVWGVIRRFWPAFVLIAIAAHYLGLRAELAGYRAEETAAAAERRIARNIVERAAENTRLIAEVRAEVARCDQLVADTLVLADEWERRYVAGRRATAAAVADLEAAVAAADLDSTSAAALAVSSSAVSRAIAEVVAEHEGGGS